MKKDYKKIALAARRKILEMIYKAHVSHIGSNFSCVDIASVLYENADLKKDKIIWSKGWAAATAYYFLAEKGVIPKEDLDTFCQGDSKYIGLAEPTVPGIPFAGGSMGMGMPAGIGFSLAKKLNGETGKIFCIISDGEIQIGTFYESLLIASHHQLSNLIVLCDNNSWQAMGKVKNILNIEPLKKKIKNFGWSVQEINGHNYKQIENALKNVSKISPNFIICNTIKGMGFSKFCDNNLYHYKHITDEEYKEALEELC